MIGQDCRGGSSNMRVYWRNRCAGLVAWVVGVCTGLRRWAFCGTTRRSGALVGDSVIKGFKEFKERMVLGMRGVDHAGMSLAGGKGEGFRRQGSRRLHTLLSGGMWRADAPGSIPTLRREQLVGKRVIKGFKELKERRVLGKMGVTMVGVVMAVVCVGCRERGLVDYALLYRADAGDDSAGYEKEQRNEREYSKIKAQKATEADSAGTQPGILPISEYA